MPYERLVQWLATPIAALIGLGATSLFHANISKNSAATASIFIATLVVQLILHFKWMHNLPKWWQQFSFLSNIQATKNPPQQPERFVRSSQDAYGSPSDTAEYNDMPPEITSPGHPSLTVDEAADPQRGSHQ